MEAESIMAEQPHVGERPLFRPEAVNYRLSRHLGEVFVSHSLKLKWILALPIAVLAILIFGASQLTYRKKVVSTVQNNLRTENVLQLELVLPAEFRPSFQAGESYPIQLGREVARTTAFMTSIIETDCEGNPGWASQEPSSGDHCLVCTVELENQASFTAEGHMGVSRTQVWIWSQPRHYFPIFASKGN